MFDMFNAIVQFFSDIVNWVLSLLSSCFTWLQKLLTDSLEAIVSDLFDLFPDLSSFWGLGSSISSYLGLLNSWIAVDVAITLFVAYFAFIVVLISVKLFIKLFIPTVG